MKITKTRLQQIIKEEVAAIREEENLANELRDDMEELMRSGLFSKADRKDKMLARRKIYSVLKRTRLYGGENTFYEEMLDDALGGHGSDLQQRLADAAGMDVVDWAEKLSAWATGGGDFDDDYDLQENKIEEGSGPSAMPPEGLEEFMEHQMIAVADYFQFDQDELDALTKAVRSKDYAKVVKRIQKLMHQAYARLSDKEKRNPYKAYSVNLAPHILELIGAPREEY